MKEKIKSALETKYKNLGFGDKAFDGVASYLSKTVKEEKDVDTAIADVEDLLKSFQGDIDKVRNEKSTLQKELDELKAKGEKKPDEKKPEEKDDLEAKLDALLEAKIKPLQDKLTGYEAKETKAARQSLILSKAKELKITQERIDEGFVIADDADEATIGTYLSKVRQNEVAKGLESKNEGMFALSTPEAKGKELAKDWASKLPDA